MQRLRTRLRAEDGSALMVSFFILLSVLAFSAATFQASVLLSHSTNKETNAQQAFQAADSGIDTAMHRLALINPAATSCIANSGSTVVASTTCTGGWGALSTSEGVAAGAGFTYQVSTSPAPSSCPGAAVPGVPDRCVVGTGTSNGVQRRLAVRVTTQGGAGTQPLSDGTVKAIDSVKIETGVTFTGATSGSALLVNSKLEVGRSTTITGAVKVGRKAKVKGITQLHA